MLLPQNFKVKSAEEFSILSEAERKDYDFLLWFYSSFFVGEGGVGESDGYDHYQTFAIKKKAFQNDFRNLIKQLPKHWDEDAEKEVYLFSRFDKGWHSTSPYDCSGALIGHRQTVKIIDDDWEWIVVVRNSYSYDL